MIRNPRAEEMENTWGQMQGIQRTALFSIPGSQERGSESLNADKSCSISLKKNSNIEDLVLMGLMG